ncbi:MAG TPA: ATP-binding protein [Candidatus Binatia bacterium]|jgi:signal transduction histidine kinase
MFHLVQSNSRHSIKSYFQNQHLNAANHLPRVAYYGAAAAIVGVAAIGSALLSRLPGQTLYSLFFAAVVVSTWFGGVGPGLLATVLSTVCLDLVTAPGYDQSSGFFRLSAYFLVALLTNSLIGERNRAAEVLRRARDGLEARVRQRTAELTRANEKLQAEVSERREAEARLAKVTQQLIERNAELWRLQRERGRVERLAAMGRVTGTIAHELGTPLNSVLGYTELLAQEPLSDIARRRLDVIAAQVQRIVGIIDRHLSRARTSLPKHYRIDLNRTVRETLELFKPIFEQHGVAVAASLARDLPSVRGDDASLQRVLINLLDNALDALPDGGTVTVTTRMDGGDAARIEIADDGIGIAPEMLSKVFELFASTKPPGKGTGLGLAISQELIRSHGGSMSIASRPGNGTTVTVVLPAERDVAAATWKSSEYQDSHS